MKTNTKWYIKSFHQFLQRVKEMPIRHLQSASYLARMNEPFIWAFSNDIYATISNMSNIEPDGDKNQRLLEPTGWGP